MRAPRLQSRERLSPSWLQSQSYAAYFLSLICHTRSYTNSSGREPLRVSLQRPFLSERCLLLGF
jgi:hypothetical protein